MNPLRIDPNGVYELGDIALSLDITTTVLNKARSRGELPFVRRGRRVFITGRNLLAWLEPAPMMRGVSLMESVNPRPKKKARRE